MDCPRELSQSVEFLGSWEVHGSTDNNAYDSRSEAVHQIDVPHKQHSRVPPPLLRRLVKMVMCSDADRAVCQDNRRVNTGFVLLLLDLHLHILTPSHTAIAPYCATGGIITEQQITPFIGCVVLLWSNRSRPS